MAWSRSSPRFRLMATLCIALIALFAGLSLSRAMDQIQHMPGVAHHGGHMLLSALTMEEAHDDDHDAALAEQDEGQDRLPGGHHHHSDSSAGIILIGPTMAAAPHFSDVLPAMINDPAEAGSIGDGQDRPPRLSTLRV